MDAPNEAHFRFEHGRLHRTLYSCTQCTHATDGWVVALTCLPRRGVVRKRNSLPRQHKPQYSQASVVKKRDFVPTKIIT